MAISDDYSIDYANKIIRYIGGFTGGVPDTIYLANSVYSFLQDTFDEPAQMDDPVPMSAQTPTEYTLINAWFMDDDTIKSIYGGSVQTLGWKRTTGSVVGIVQVEYTVGGGSEFISTDIGKPVTHSTGLDDGVLLGYDTTRGVCWIRPDTNAAGDDWDSTSGSITVTGGTGSVTQDAAAVDGETVWGNIYTLGTIETDTEIYVVQEDDYAEVASPTLRKITAWWNEDVDFSGSAVAAGHIDVLIKVKESDALVNGGRLIVLGRQFSKLYDHFPITVTGGRNAVPLATGDDLNNTTGDRIITTGVHTGTYQAEEVIIGATSGAEGVVTSFVADTSISYYLINDLTDFQSGEVIDGQTSSASSTSSGAPSDDGPADDTSITATFGDTQQDVNNNGTDEEYSVTINCNSQPLSEVYERLKYLTRRGATGDIDAGAQTVTGEWYTGIGDVKMDYVHGSQDDPFTNGELITGASSGATGIVTAKHDTGASIGFVILREVKGTFTVDEQIDGGTSGHSADVDAAPEAIAPVKASPFGTFAGGTFFGARGVYLSNVAGADATNYQLIDSEGNVVNPPNVVSVSIGGLVSGDRGAVFVLTGSGGTIDKSQHGLNTGNNQGDTDIVVDVAIPADTPAAGVIRCVDVSAAIEQRYRYASFTGSTFTLVTAVSGTHTGAGGSTTTLTDSGADFGGTDDVEVGDLIRNTTDSDAIWQVKEVTDSNNLAVELVLSGGGDDDWDASDAYVIHQLTQAYNGAEDTAYVPLIDGVSTGTELSNTLTFSLDIYTVARVRNSSGGSKILPFETPGTVTSAGLTVTAIRTDDTIAT